MSKTLESFCESVRNWTYTAKSIAQEYLTKIQSDTTNSFVRTHESYVEEHSEIFSDRDLCGAAIGVKDIFMTQWYETSCGSKMLEGYIPPYTATCIQNLEKAWGLMIWKTNMDEFAMWTTWETSYFGPTTNPYDQTRVAWWSSSWSAAAVAWDLCIAIWPCMSIFKNRKRWGACDESNGMTRLSWCYYDSWVKQYCWLVVSIMKKWSFLKKTCCNQTIYGRMNRWRQ